MYIENTQRYYVGNQQHIRKANFLILIQGKERNSPIKALVRKVALEQFGHFMMGYARIYGHTLTVSGSYGSDGLPIAVEDDIYERAAVLLPQDLYNAWNNGGGWNSAGKESGLMRKWALENLDELRK